MDRSKRYIVLLRSSLQNRHIFGVKRTLAGVVQDISFFVNVRMLRAFLELWFLRIFVKRQIPQLYSVIRLVTDSKSFVFEEPGICKEGFLLRSSKNAQPFTPLFLAVFDTGFQKVCGIPMSLEGAGHPQAVNVHIPIRIDRNPGVLRRYVLDKTLAALYAL